ncbi:uncharacterized protein LOC142332799 [Lycorma delicatula]|uniref:uncharacterized protein LOC142332799 n=1 Tax=Lycorma delicatula TaxID=130591 RepID=UPI003F5126B4
MVFLTHKNCNPGFFLGITGEADKNPSKVHSDSESIVGLIEWMCCVLYSSLRSASKSDRFSMSEHVLVKDNQGNSTISLSKQIRVSHSMAWRTSKQSNFYVCHKQPVQHLHPGDCPLSASLGVLQLVEYKLTTLQVCFVYRQGKFHLWWRQQLRQLTYMCRSKKKNQTVESNTNDNNNTSDTNKDKPATRTSPVPQVIEIFFSWYNSERNFN